MTPLLDAKGLGELLGMSPAAIRQMRYRDPNLLPPAIRVGEKLVRWHPEDVEQWLQVQRGASRDLTPSDCNNAASFGGSDGR